jgi:hypothetical protein
VLAVLARSQPEYRRPSENSAIVARMGEVGKRAYSSFVIHERASAAKAFEDSA